jgi:hypothetical protein
LKCHLPTGGVLAARQPHGSSEFHATGGPLNVADLRDPVPEDLL